MNLLEELKTLGGGTINPTVFSAIKLRIGSLYDFLISQRQIEVILENVPGLFPENMRVRNYGRLPNQQQKGYIKVAEVGDRPCTVSVIVEVIKIGLDLKESFRKNAQIQANIRLSGSLASGLTIIERPEVVARA